MNTNTPSHDPGTSVDNNPYYSRATTEPSLDALDSGAPVLQSADAQRLNKKAMMFLAGVALLVVAFAAMIFTGRGRDTEPEKAPRQERVEVPTAPIAPPLPAPPAEAPPIALATSTPPLLPPPLPEPVIPADAYAPGERAPSLLERRTMAEQANSRPSLAEIEAMRAQQQPAQLEVTKTTGAMFLNQPDTLLLRGTFIRCALETIAIVFAGYQIAFAHKRISDVAPILIGGLLIGAAGQLAKMVIGEPASGESVYMIVSSLASYA